MTSTQPLPDIAGWIRDYVGTGQAVADFPTGSSERLYQQWLNTLIGNWLTNSKALVLLGEASGGGISPIRGLGAGSWPDLAVVARLEQAADVPLLAVEVKCLKKRGLPNKIAHALGQALIYRAVYPKCLVVFFLLEDVDVSYLPQLMTELPPIDIDVAVVPVFEPRGDIDARAK